MDRNVLTIGGLDPSGCAGVSADLKTFAAWRVHGLCVVTAITAQNTQGVEGVFAVTGEIVRAQLQSIVSDIEVHAVKIGLLPDVAALKLVVALCKEYQLTNIVVDPVLRSTTGYDFADEKMIDTCWRSLFPIADVITPNLDEASLLSRMKVEDVSTMKSAAAKLHEIGARSVVITGGHLKGPPIDVFFDGKEYREFEGSRIVSENTRGTGCTFSSILAVHLARNQDLPTAVIAAKEYIARALTPSWRLGKGKGPLNVI